MKRIDHFRETVWNDPDLTANEKLLLVAMTKWMDVNTLAACRPGHARIVARTSLSPRTVRRTIRALEDKGWLIEERRGSSAKGQQREASMYRGAVPDYGQSGRSTTATQSRDYGQSGHPPFQGPSDPDGAGAPGSPNHASRSRRKHPNGCTCFDCTYGTPP